MRKVLRYGFHVLAVLALLSWLLVLASPARGGELELGLGYVYQPGLFFDAGPELSLGYEADLSSRTSLRVRGSLGAVDKALPGVPGGSWTYGADLFVGRGSCQLQVGMTGSGYALKAALGPLVGFRCRSYRDRLRWGAAYQLQPTEGRGLLPEDLRQTALVAGSSWEFPSAWFYSTRLTWTEYAGRTAGGASILFGRRWR